MAFLPTNRRKFIGLAAAAGLGAIAVDSTVFEPNRPRVVRQEIALGRWPARLEGFTIALLSDFHYDPFFSEHPVHAAIGLVNNLRPDLVVLTGDFVSMPAFRESEAMYRTAASAADPCARLLGQIKAPHGLWAVLGNHDVFTDPDVVSNALHEQGIQILINQCAAIEAAGARFWLAGVNDVVAGIADLDEALRLVPNGEPTVLLAHEPDYADDVTMYPVDLQLSGHSHGGQIRLPLLGAPYPPYLGRKYVWGLYRIGPLTLYTNPGLGTLSVPVRWNCPPEITLLTLRRALGQ